MRILGITGLLFIVITGKLSGAEDISVEDLNAQVRFPSFDAKISLGFNYDMLRAPTDVSFEYPKGFLGFNIPIEKSFNLRDFATYLNPAIDSVFSDTTMFSDGETFRPKGVAKQNSNITVRVDVPMLGGVASFSNTQNFYLNYQNALGNPAVFISPDSLMDGLSFLMRGTINVPVDLKTSWETMTFGYAYRINPFFTVALNLNRHLFNIDLRARGDIDILGRLKYENSQGDGNAAAGISINQELDYSSDKFYGRAYGHYEAECWTPTLGLKAWRFTVTSRFGLKKRAKGKFYAGYSIPFFVDPVTFELLYDFDDPELFNDPEFRQNLIRNAADSVIYTTKDENGKEPGMFWQIPTGLTLSFDVFPEVLSISYTKIFGEIKMRIDQIAREKRALESGSTRIGQFDTLSLDAGVSVDHVVILQCRIYRAFLNIGVFGMDFRHEDKENLLGSKMPYMHMGSMAMLPIFNFGTTIGSKLQLLIEMDVVPLPAFKTGFYYYF